MKPPAKSLIVVAALLTRGGREVLIARRPDHLSSAGRWEFPGGKVERGEDPRDALVRECREELGIDIVAGRIYESIHTRNDERELLLLFYTAMIVNGTSPQSLEGNEFRWVTVDELEGFDLLEPDRPLIGQFRRRWPGFEER